MGAAMLAAQTEERGPPSGLARNRSRHEGAVDGRGCTGGFIAAKRFLFPSLLLSKAFLMHHLIPR